MTDEARHFRMSRRGVLSAVAVGALGAVAAACSKDGTKTTTAGTSAKKPDPVASISYTPDPKKESAPNPTTKFAVTVDKGVLNPDVKLLNSRGTAVKGELSEDQKTFTISEALGYDVEYTWAGSAMGEDRQTVPIDAKFTTLNPSSQVNVVLNIGDGQEVGVAAPLILKFDSTVNDKKAVERALTVTTEPKTEGSWAWLGEDNGSRAHWRTKEYFAPGTKVSMAGKLYGLDHGDGAYGAADVTVDFTVGRNQVVKAEASSHQIVVVRDGATLMTLPCSYGEGDLDRNVTRSGIHVVSEKHEDFYMSNPAAGYFNVHERFAVRISNNGEFIHANPETVGVQGSSNVTNGCINLSLDSAQQYFATAVYGDPVEVTGTRIDLSEADGDIYDWIYDWDTWTGMSALAGEPDTSSAPATPSDAPQLSGTSSSPSPTPSAAPVG
ncbi:L,D-transpeptidase [Williamsia sterculiae]|uniref:Lipoprotein-anchoring transpeptidase ErfK/SrfK n=1 Tax=Williamsia sterculiae TaxID=1344003 RepID=A0A1N7GZ84_9NOCA|nr:Ig-like domain-containing protein [Williamsia sterculiae]SIS17904.1 Lipoprotein-anchoring transpeptidase ErfK/SrfK [Williamsia sterculiae]